MARILEKPIIVVLLLLVLSISLYFLHLDKMALTDPDEAFYAQTVKEMVQRNEWLTPYLYGKPQFEKPILFYSLVEISYKVFGINEFAARFPSAGLSFLGLIAIYLLGRLLFNNRVGIFSAIILATSIEYLVLSIACVTDMVLFTFMLLGVLFFFYGQIRNKGYFYILASASFALATLTKGPIGLLLPASIIVAYLFITKDFAIFKRWKALLAAAIVFMAIMLPWYLVMCKLYSKEFIEAFFGFHNVTRFLVPEHKIGAQFYYNIPVVLGGFMPWSTFLPLGLWQFFKKAFARRAAQGAGRNERNHVIFIILWFFVIFIFFSVSSTKLPTYIFPCFISLALITGKLWDDFLGRQNEPKFLLGMRVSYYILLAAIVLSLIGGYIFLSMDYPNMIPAAIITAACLLFGLALSLIAFVKKRFIISFFMMAYAIALALYPLTALALPALEGHETARPVSQAILHLFREGDVIACERDFRPGITFYTGKIPEIIDSGHPLADLLRSGKRVFGVLKEKNIRDEVRILYKCGERVLVTNSARGKKQ